MSHEAPPPPYAPQLKNAPHSGYYPPRQNTPNYYPVQDNPTYPYPNQGAPSYSYPPIQSTPTSYGATTVIVQPGQDTVFVGGCPACRVGILEMEYTCPGIFLAIFFFPIGLLCCYALRQRRCPNCGAVFG